MIVVKNNICGVEQKNGNPCTAKCYWNMKTCRRHDTNKPKCEICGLILKKYICPKEYSPCHVRAKQKLYDKRKAETLTKQLEEKNRADVKREREKLAYENAMKKRIDLFFSNDETQKKNHVPHPIQDLIVSYFRPKKFQRVPIVGSISNQV